jgi:hypothetical protein
MFHTPGSIDKMRTEGYNMWNDPLDLGETKYGINEKNEMGERSKKIIRDILDEKYNKSL